MPKMGRPSKYKVAYCDHIIQHMARGLSIESFAGVVDVAASTIYEWRDAHSDFSEAIKRGEAKSRLIWEELGLSAAKGELKGFNATAWVYNMKNRFGWSDRDREDSIEPPTGTIRYLPIQMPNSVYAELMDADARRKTIKT